MKGYGEVPEGKAYLFAVVLIILIKYRLFEAWPAAHVVQKRIHDQEAQADKGGTEAFPHFGPQAAICIHGHPLLQSPVGECQGAGEKKMGAPEGQESGCGAE